MKTQEIQEYNRKKIICAIHKIENYEEALKKEEGDSCHYLYKTNYGEQVIVGDIRRYGYNTEKNHPDAFLLKVIGKPLTLNKVLLSLEPYSNNYGFIAGNIARIDRKKQTYNFICKWDLSKETLEEQSEETQRAIYELLTEK
jgi:hypothetical protein